MRTLGVNISSYGRGKFLFFGGRGVPEWGRSDSTL